MTSEGKEIGDWDDSSFTLTPVGDGAFRLEAENEELTFLPDSPDDFASAVAHSRDPAVEPVDPLPAQEVHVVKEGPPPKALTLVLFYLLLAGTIAMAVWAAASLF